MLTLRDYKSVPFGSGIISNLSIRPSNDTLFVKTIIEFYDWCVTKNIFPNDQILPKLSTPNAHLESLDDQSDSQPSSQSGSQPSDQPSDQLSDQTNDQPDDQGDKTGSHSKHSNKVGKAK